MSPAKTAEPIEMPFIGMTHGGPRNHVLDKGQCWMNRGGDNMAMRPVTFAQPAMSKTKTNGKTDKQRNSLTVGFSIAN